MLHTVLDTAGLPARERVESWNAFVADLLVPNTFHIEQRADFQGSLRAAELGATQVVAPVYSPLRCRRTAKLIRRSDPEVYVVALSRRGRQGVSQSRRVVTPDAGELVLYSSSLPYEAWSDVDRGTAASVVAQVPRTMVPLPDAKVDRLLAGQFPTRDGMGALLAQFLTQLADDTGAFRPADGPRLGVVLVDLVTALIAHRLDDLSDVPAECRQETLFLQMKAFIHRHLADPELSAGTVAAAHHVSTRQVHRLFQQQGHGAAAYIRRQRLEHARRDLADPGLAHVAIHAIARRWGFARPEVFTRAFRHAYGILPRDYRGRFLRGRGDRGDRGEAPR